MSLWAKFKDLLKDEPIYAPPSRENWLALYNQEVARADLAERKLAMLRGLSDGMIKYGWGLNYGHDIRTILNMTKEEMDENYGDD